MGELILAFKKVSIQKLKDIFLLESELHLENSFLQRKNLLIISKII